MMMTSWLWALALSTNCYAGLVAAPDVLLRQKHSTTAVIRPINILLTDQEAKDVEKSIGFEFKDRIFSFFSIYDKDKLLGYAGLLTRRIRTKDQTALYSISAQGEIQEIELIAFYEPPEYKPRADWLAQFKGKQDDSSLRLRNEIRVVTGATLTAQSFVQGSKLILAVWQKKKP